MTVDEQSKRFCTCSDSPVHVEGAGSLEHSTGTDPDALGRETLEVGAGTGTVDESVRFCTCSETPTVEGERRDTDPEAAIEDEDERTTNDESSVSPAGGGDSSIGSGHAQETGSISDSGAGLETPVVSSVSELLPGESVLFTSTTHGRGGSEVVLTERRVLLRGAPDADVLHASMRFSEIDSVTISRSRPSRRSLVWGLVGIAASIGMWQALDGVGNLRLIIGVIVVLMSAVLLADYFLRPPDLVVGLRANSRAEMKIGFGQSHVDEADRFAARVISMMEMRSGD